MVSLSIVMPVKNGMPFISKTIESVLNQSYSDFELIISDDNSQDGTREFLDSISDSRVSITSPKTSLKVDKHWTFVTQLASAKYIKLLCADDILTEGSIDRQMNALLANPALDIAVSSRSIIDSLGKRILKKHGRAGLVGEVSGLSVLERCFKSGTNILGEPSGLIFKGEMLKKHLPWDGKFPYMLDFELYTRLLPEASVVFLDTVDSEFRIHGSSISSKERKSHFKQFNQIYKVCVDCKLLTPLSKANRLRMIFFSYVKTQIRQVIFWYATRQRNDLS
jgi:glycosyltransferase involved in cell wall biosynthesis